MRSEEALFAYLDSVPRVSLGHFPTPIEPMERLSTQLGGPSLCVKRDDMTGLGFGGNKIRALEFILPDAIAASADVLVTAGVAQSNSARQVAAAAARVGLGCHVLLITDRVATVDADYSETGNVFLDRLFGATFETMSIQDDRDERLIEVAGRLRSEGKTPYIVPYGCSSMLGATGYLNAALEIAHQGANFGAPFTHVVHGSGTGGTQAGLIAGFEMLGLDTEVIGIDVDADEKGVRQRVAKRLNDLTEALALDSLVDRIQVDSGYSAGAYGKADEATVEAIQLVARLEALPVDPVYSGKGLAGLIGLTRQGRFPSDARVLFLHTGGEPALFAYRSLF